MGLLMNTELRGSPAAVHGDDLAGDERRLAGSHEHDGIRDLSGGAHALERHSRGLPVPAVQPANPSSVPRA